MASGVAHNFNNALTGVLGYAELLLMRPDLGGDARSMVESIRASGRDAAAVIARLMKFCRAQELARDFVSLDLNDVIRDVVQASQRPPHAENSYPAIHWRVNLCAASPVWGHVADLREVIANLIANAVRAMPQGGTVVVGTCVEDSSVILEIADTGIGMPKEVREHCFEPFYVPKAEHGAGLGLAIVHGIIKRHGGRIDVWSEPDQGTRFTIHLPRPNAHDDASADGGDANNP
jgi:signal transduction histidine kinase